MNLERTPPPNPYDFLPALPSFTLGSHDVAQDKTVALDFVHDSAGGANLSPHLRWSGFPAETKGFAVTCYDPDAPTASGWWHLLLMDVPAAVTELDRGALAANADLPGNAFTLRTDYGTPGYQGCSPPPGDYPHRYFFVVHALDTESLGIDAEVTPAIGGFHLTAHAIARATLVPVYAH